MQSSKLSVKQTLGWGIQVNGSPIIASVSDEGFRLNGGLFTQPASMAQFYGVLGQPSRIFPAGPPAPYGFRNNHMHMFDAFGIYLNEHHATRLIESITFAYDPLNTTFPIDNRFSGELVVSGCSFVATMTERDILKLGILKHTIAGEYKMRLGGCWVGVSMMGPSRAG